MSLDFIDSILPKVSRTFALNIVILLRKQRTAVTCAYLICRAIDTIEDSPNLSSKQKITLLQEFIDLFSLTKASNGVDYLEWGVKSSKLVVAKPDEIILLENFDKVMDVFFSLSSFYQQVIKNNVLEMAIGMKKFISKYQNKVIKILADEKELIEYCYYVAGTVGEMLSMFFTDKLYNQTQKEKVLKHSVDFGLGLQMVNIAKDFLTDKKREWVYIPESFLEEANISLNEFISNDHYSESIKNIHLKLINKAENYLDKALIYIMNLPRRHFRNRLFCLLPLILAIKTTNILKKQAINSKIITKISKFEVLKSIFFSKLFVFSNFLIKSYYFKIKKS